MKKGVYNILPSVIIKAGRIYLHALAYIGGQEDSVYKAVVTVPS